MAKLLTKDEDRRLAASFGKLPEVLQRAIGQRAALESRRHVGINAAPGGLA